MTSPFSKASELTGSTFFKPKDYETALALLVEPKEFQADVPAKDFNGNAITRDEVIADITVFANTEALEAGTPTEILKSVKITHGMLVGTTSKILDGAMVSIVRKIPTQKGSGWAWRDSEGDAETQVAAYYEAREEAAANAPDFG